MCIDKYKVYVAGFVGKGGGVVKLRTYSADRALNWTKANEKYGELAVCKGITQDDLDYEEAQPGYIGEHLVENVAGFDGKFTKGFLYQLEEQGKRAII